MQDKLKHFFNALIDAAPEDIVISPESDGCESFDFLDDATNVYRTKNYIVKQRIVFSESRLGVTTVSNDVFYERTPERDEEYEEAFADLLDIDGRRVPAMGSIRKYVK